MNETVRASVSSSMSCEIYERAKLLAPNTLITSIHQVSLSAESYI